MGMLDGRTAIVTGASRGIGRAIALELARVGARVVVNYRSRQAEAEAVVAEIAEGGGCAAVCQADVTDEAQVRRLIAFTLRQFGGVDILVANAGVGGPARRGHEARPVGGGHPDQPARHVPLHPRGAAPDDGQKSGSIVCISSVAADHAGRGHVNYVAAKGGINAMTRSLRSS